MPQSLLLSTWSFGQRGNNAAWPALAAGGGALDAAETACRAVEADPVVDSVGYGGLPDRHGQMSLDGCIMLSPRRFGSICAARRTLHVVSAARLLMECDERRTLAGEGADAYAESVGLRCDDLLSPKAREKWEAWRRDPHTVDWSQDSGLGPGAESASHDTIGVLALDAAGTLAGACSSSGLAYKRPGRVGDSPLIGHGLYVEPDVGAVVATGDGELISAVCGAFLAVEELRRGGSARSAVQGVLERVAALGELPPTAQVAFIVVTPDGAWQSGCLRHGFRVAVADETGSRILEPQYVHLPDTSMQRKPHGHEVS
jgi:isoaspartyl peptidase/L-asparaginase-like protein (Ntn-hydrolase superfamily)